MNESTSVGCSSALIAPRLGPVVTALRLRFAELLVPEEDDTPPARRSRRDWIVDSALFLLAAGLGSAALVSAARHGLDRPLVVVDAIVGAALCLALWWRRRWPFALGLVSLPALAISSSAGAASVIILFTVAAYRRWQLAFLVFVLQVAMLPIGRAVHPQGDSFAAYYVGGILGPAAIVAWGMFQRGRRQERRERLRRAQAEEQLRIEQIRHAERTRIAREMHDVLAHRISLLSLHAGALEFRPDAPAEEVARAAAVIRASARQALEDLRAVIGVLRDGTDGEAPKPPQPTLAALPGLLEESRAAGMRLHAELRVPDLAAVPDAVGRHALRIVQEALTTPASTRRPPRSTCASKERPEKGLRSKCGTRRPYWPPAQPRFPGRGLGSSAW
jgi:signal transduction histidine kinase